MTAIHAGQEIHVTLEMPNGDVFSGQTMVAMLSRTRTVSPPAINFFSGELIAEPMTWEMELCGMGELTFIPRQDYARRVQTERRAGEWKCGYCGAINDYLDKQCAGCNAWRPFAYGEIER